MIEPVEVSDVEVAFPAEVDHLMPPMQEIPEQFGGVGERTDVDPTLWREFQFDWFFNRMADPSFISQPGINCEAAYRHLAAIQGSWAPKHQMKEAAVSYLASIWFSKVVYTRKDQGRQVTIG